MGLRKKEISLHFEYEPNVMEKYERKTDDERTNKETDLPNKRNKDPKSEKGHEEWSWVGGIHVVSKNNIKLKANICAKYEVENVEKKEPQS